MDCMKEYKRWMKQAIADVDIANELKRMDDSQIEDAFYRDLAFGTGGLRGVIGAGTNRMNVYTVAKASQGLADYLKKSFPTPSVAIGYDSRIKSDMFARVAAGVFAANGIQVNQMCIRDRYEAVIGTHLDKAHPHNHIVFNACSYADGRMFRNNFNDYYNGYYGFIYPGLGLV